MKIEQKQTVITAFPLDDMVSKNTTHALPKTNCYFHKQIPQALSIYKDQGINTQEFIWYKIKIMLYEKGFSIYLDYCPTTNIKALFSVRL